ncbi:hypothetical protein [Alistipes finegoldii]|uniref:hypothetical protein n=1 Tax=Alistipes finegoldii TaxID=214856 RepID=UPI001C37DC2C|nr:hypothetical protein [Alistipes finegoldii]MBV4324731.1 hypothetical protein [Alistipes finegoldii]MBV4350469.1 hypothetical protein [Alistipes finegoldii]MBV4371513.1 hypothetical protein [Alistipes finegoldii]
MGDYYIELPFNQLQYIQIPQGSYILYKGRKFEIMATVYPEFDNKTGGYKYTLKFEAQQNHMKRFVCFWLGGDNPEAVFHNTTDLESFGALIVANMNKHLGVETWSVGTIDVENPKATKLVSFNGDKCWDILNTIAETFEVEWWTEENGDLVSLNFGKLERGTPEEFKRGDVVKSIPAKKGDDSSYGTRFYVFGSTRNLTSDYGQAPQGGETNHVSEIRLRLPNGQRYIDAIPNLDKSAIVEQVVFFDDIYPKNTETITSIETVDREIIEGQTDKAYVMYCKDTPFLPSDMIEGETLGATFTSGSLMGRDFELSINYKPETWKPEDGFDKKFEIIAQVETSGESQLIVPNESLHPEPGDTFVLTGVKLPQQRIEEAEEELLKAGQAYAAKNSSDTDVYTCETNPVYCTVNDKNYNAGQAVLLVDPRFGLDGRLSRIQGYEKKLYNEYIATYTIGDNTPYSRIGSIESDVKATLYSQRIGVTDSGAAIYLITRYDSTAAEDYNAYSAKRALWQFANKQFPDTFKGKMTFEDGAQFGDFATGITGIGGLIDKKGNAEMQSLKLRGFLEVPELRYNRVDITMGDTWFAPSAGIIESVDTEAKTITLKLEEGEIGSPRVGDICMGIFHSSESSDNATEDYDDSKGNRRFAGFATCYFRITEELGTTTYKTFKYQLRPVSAAYTKQYHPAPSMTFVGYGSFSNEARQTSRYETRTYQRYLKGVSDWEFISSNIAAQYGDLSNLSVFGIDMKGYSAYLNNIYMSGVIHQFTPGGEEIPTINDRGKWLASETYNKNDEVYHNNAKWRCLVDGTKSEPSTSSEAWVLLMHVPLSSVVPVYKQQNEKPALPTGSTVPPDGWSLEYPEGGDSGASTDVTNIIIDADNEGDVTQDGVFYKLAGKGNNSTVSCKIQFDAISPGATLVLDITAYSEKGYDKLAVGKINVQNVNTADSDTYEAEVSGNGVSTTVVVTAPSAGRHFVNVVYSKDSSGDANGDYGLFRIAYNTSKTIPLWVSFGSVIDGVVQSWSDPARISGADGRPGTDGRPGVDGTDYEWIFTRTTSETAPATPASQDEDDYLPDGWTDDAEGPDNTHPFEWTCKRSKVNGHWGDFSTPSLWAKYSFNGEDGIDGEGVEYIFTRTKTDDPSDIPDVPRVAEYDNPPAPWTDDPMGVDDIYQYEWVSKRIKVNGEWSAFSTPALWAKYSFDGTDGRPGDWTSYVFKKSIDKPGAPISTKPIPDGWEDAPSGDGIWWMSKATINGSTGQASALTWSDPIKVTGEDGQLGPYIDFKYASSSDDSIGPDIESNVREPDGWYDNPPALSSGEYLWMTKAQIDANDELVEPWSDPVRISGEQGKPGDKGDPGYQGCIIRLTEWVSGVEYRNDADLESDSLRYIDIVTVYENNRQLKFQCRQTHTSSNSNKPSGGTTSTYWQQLNDMVPIYTPLLFAENAVINFLQGMEFVVHNSKTDISENTIIAGLVGGDIPLFVGSNTPDNAPFRVAKDGSFTATKANIIGRIEATSGKIGNFTIDNDYWLQSSLSPSSGKDCSLFMSAARITLENIDDNYKNTFDVSAYPTSTMGAVNHSVLTVNTNRKSSQDINYYNIGIDISAEGSFGTNPLNPRTKCGNHALYLRKGDVCGLRLYNRKISSNVTLDDMDCFVTVDSDGGKRTITLPYNPQDGQLYYIRNIGTKGVQLNGNGKQIAIHTQGAWVYSDSWTDRESRNLIYCTSVGCWVMFK